MTVPVEPGSEVRVPVESGEIALGCLRVLLLPIVVLGATLVSHPTDRSGPFGVIAAVGLIYACWLLAVLLARVRRSERRPVRVSRAEPFIDLLLICALVYTSGGPFAQARVAFFALPLVAAFRLRPRLTAIWSALAVLAYAVVSVAHPALHDQDAPGQVLVGALYLGWAGTAAVVLSSLLAARARSIGRLAEERRSLVRQALEAESRARRRLASALHDESVQTLLVAGQELQDARRGDREAVDRAERAVRLAIRQLRSEIADLHPHVLDHAGLPAALTDLAQRWSSRTGLIIDIEVDPAAAGPHDDLLFSVARELIANAVRHAGAHHVEVALATARDGAELRVSDDGSGMSPARRAEAVVTGRLGLATITERVHGVGGRLVIDSSPDRGTTVLTTLPAARRAREVLRTEGADRPSCRSSGG